MLHSVGVALAPLASGRPTKFALHLQALFWDSSCWTVAGRPSKRRRSRYGGLHPLTRRRVATFVLSTWDWLPCLELVLPGITALPGLG